MVYVIISGILFGAWIIWLLFLDRRECIYCHKELWIPLGAEHIFCALRYHPRRSMMGWYLWFMGLATGKERKESYKRKERWLKNVTMREGNFIEIIY